jgi:hypothetical protein
MKRIRLHVQTFSHRPALYRITPERWAAAAARHAELAARLDVTFDDEAATVSPTVRRACAGCTTPWRASMRCCRSTGCRHRSC